MTERRRAKPAVSLPVLIKKDLPKNKSFFLRCHEFELASANTFATIECMVVVTLAALIVLSLLVIFQLALVCGAPFGQFAWGGQHNVLPVKLRIGSVVSVAIYAVFAAFALSKAEFVILVSNAMVLNVGLWAITAYLVLGIFLNSVSRSKPERYLMTPVAAALAVCFLILALA